MEDDLSIVEKLVCDLIFDLTERELHLIELDLRLFKRQAHKQRDLDHFDLLTLADIDVYYITCVDHLPRLGRGADNVAVEDSVVLCIQLLYVDIIFFEKAFRFTLVVIFEIGQHHATLSETYAECYVNVFTLARDLSDRIGKRRLRDDLTVRKLCVIGIGDLQHSDLLFKKLLLELLVEHLSDKLGHGYLKVIVLRLISDVLNNLVCEYSA